MNAALPAMYLGEEAFIWCVRPVVRDVVTAVAREMGLSRIELLGEARDPRVVRGRFAVAFIASVALGRGVTCIGAGLNRDHSTIAHALRRATTLRETDPAFRSLTNRLIRDFTR